ncbi:homoserine dehydrogenase [Telmatospirillum sp.]|uniref:homoserine dehydrogenase n=1 Tax=Telmatospirillum sp. TaxID=2079197 RepID=UPI002845ACD3|nr:homoserine dehydrogenase [Telmatospirillum sp.]MDR3438827.1 homoserine dehydrogenase [Telmatospirillum sp.]
MDELKIAIAGLGTVGGGTVKLLHQHADLLTARTGRRLHLVAAAALEKPADLPLDGVSFFTDARAMARDADYDVLIELIGGANGVALDVVTAALGRGRHVVTANKAMVAHHGLKLAEQAEAAGVTFGYEAAVAGGIPVIKALREGLAANQLNQVYGILNGTCNYILTTMRESGREFSDVLAEAQALGYAEADPSFDIDGIDTAHKLTILTSLAFGTAVDFDKVHIEGIRHVSALDIRSAEELGYRIKLLGIARRTDAGIEQRVHPCMVPISSSIGCIEGVFNAVVAEGDFVGRTLFEGRGAGATPTASAVVADVLDIAAGRRTPTFGIPATALAPLQTAPMDNHHGAFYIRLMVRDRPGVFAGIAAALRDAEVSMESILQRGRAPGETVPVVMTVHDTRERAMRKALERIRAIAEVVDPPHLIRIEAF